MSLYLVVMLLYSVINSLYSVLIPLYSVLMSLYAVLSSLYSVLIPLYSVPGAIIGDGDRKSWDARGPMIWDNFSIFRTNCAILTSYICAPPRTCRGFSRGCCRVA